MTKTKDHEDSKSSGKFEDLSDIVEKRVQILLEEGAKAVVDFEWQKPELPDFFDKEKFELGQRTFYNNSFSMMIAKLAGLLSLLAVPTIMNVIIFTQQTGNACSAFRRYVSTILHTWIWYEKKAGVENQFLESLKIVRKKHCVAFRRSAESGLQRASQLDMALAQFGFIGFTLLCGDYLGVNASYEEVDALVHVWRVIGSMLGMEDKYNLCSGNVEETIALCRRLLDEVFLPSLASGNKNFDKISHTLIDSLWSVNPHLDPDAFIAFTLRLASKAATNNNHSIEIDISKMSLYSRYTLKFQEFVHKYLLSPKYWWSRLFRAQFNAQMRLSIFLTEYFPFLGYWRFGRRKSHVNIFAYRVN